MENLISCDTFVVLPPHTKRGVVFGKNSDRPNGEVQEVVYYPASESSDSVKCTYIEVESGGPTKAIIVSKPNWMWGAEMGANECGVAIGNEAIWTTDNEGEHDPSVKRLLGMDLVRLGLERSSNADEALNVITQLLEKYGQGGPCSKDDESFCYHNSFLIADPKSAWILETSGKHWVAHEVKSGFHNISNVISITTNIDKKSEGIEEYAKSKGLWDGQGEFNFCEAFSGEKKPGDARYLAGKKLLERLTESNNFKEVDMFKVLRDKTSEICRPCTSPFPTQGSQVSILDTNISVHWFTATPDASNSVFKPFVFTPNVKISKHTVCPENDKMAPHTLYSLHSEAFKKGTDVKELLRTMEANCVNELESVLQNVKEDLSELDELLKDCVETEVKFYR
ncbi:secernin-3 [Harmonia axyridis]|uniref:secernin-3 n=1 Tax=Harmonia axyridis TaxID=115357 RepID=UPI001E276C1C|nr:secernin-3 [Harmonia axyridis]